MVAKSYQSLEILCEPYEVNGRAYVLVRTISGADKQVRWYSDKEYAKYYGASTVPQIAGRIGVDGTDHSNDKYFKTQKEVFGFGEKGYITIFRNSKYEDKDIYKSHGCIYTRMWGWGLPSDLPMIDPIPAEAVAVQLPWSAIGNEDGSLKNEDFVKTAIEELIYEPEGEFVGFVGDKVDIEVEVIKNVPLESSYGTSFMMIFKATDDNIYVWVTAAKSWEEGTLHHIKGTIKDHKTYKGQRQTVLTRCREVK